MLVDSVPLVDSERSFTGGNQAAAQCYETLASRLSACGAMAGDASIAEEFGSAMPYPFRGALVTQMTSTSFRDSTR